MLATILELGEKDCPPETDRQTDYKKSKDKFTFIIDTKEAAKRAISKENPEYYNLFR